MASQWFLSYNSLDTELAWRLKEAIERKVPQCRVFFAPANARAGGFWSAQLAQGIADATGFILLVGEHGVGDWQLLEYYEALDRRAKSRDFPVVPVLLEGQTAPGLPFLRQLHWISSSDPTSDKDVARLLDAKSAASSLPEQLWRYTTPYRGLAAMGEQDSDYFFGRDRKTLEVLDALARAQDKIFTLLGNSGVGKSSLAQAGVIAALLRQAFPGTPERPWPSVFRDSRRWCFLTLRPGVEPVRSLVRAVLGTWQFDSTGTEMPARLNEWVNGLMAGNLGLRDLLDQTSRRYDELRLPAPSAFFLYIDQGEELYIRAGEGQRRRFSELVSAGLGDPRTRALISIRADFFGELQKDQALYEVHHPISVPPLREAQLREVVSRPAELLSARFETPDLAASIAQRTAEESTMESGALPLLSYLLDDMWGEMVRRGDGVLRLPKKAIELGSVLVDRADTFLSIHSTSEAALRRIFTLRLATVREDGEPMRRRAVRSEFTDDEWRLVSALADHPNRLLVTATHESGEPYAEVAHEAIFRHWTKLHDWICDEREFLLWRTGLESARRAWQATPEASRSEALLMGAALTQAQSWLVKRADDLPLDRDFIEQSIEHHNRATRRARRAQGLVFTLLIGIIVGLVGWMNEGFIYDRWRWWTTDRPYMTTHVQPFVLSNAAERSLKPKDTFKECDGDCPEMIVVPAGEFVMGTPKTEAGHRTEEEPQHRVTFRSPFAVSRYPVTFADWDACVAYGNCNAKVFDSYFGRGRRPVINVNRDDAHRYVSWLSQATGKRYRLLSEAEFEYAARAGTTTAYPWGDTIGTGHVVCKGCADKVADKTTPVGSFPANAFGLYDMQGSVTQWVEDCLHEDYRGAPEDGSAWSMPDCRRARSRGGSWADVPAWLRSGSRHEYWSDFRAPFIGFRVARELTP